LTSLTRGSSNNGRYNKLEDEESSTGRRRLRGVEEEDEPVGYDLSGFEGLPMKKFEPQKKLASAAETREQQRDLNEAGYAAEFERLEAQLGSGLKSVVEKPFTHTTVPSAQLQVRSPSHRRGLSGSDIVSAQALEAQEEAEKSETIVAIADIPVDISDFAAGSDFDTRSIMTADTGLVKNEAGTSYFFPQGKSRGLISTADSDASQIPYNLHGGRSPWASLGLLCSFSLRCSLPAYKSFCVSSL
jgi:hypothetical protein